MTKSIGTNGIFDGRNRRRAFADGLDQGGIEIVPIGHMLIILAFFIMSHSGLLPSEPSQLKLTHQEIGGGYRNDLSSWEKWWVSGICPVAEAFGGNFNGFLAGDFQRGGAVEALGEKFLHDGLDADNTSS